MASEAAFRSVHNTRRCSSPDIASAPTGHCPPFTWKYTRVLSCRRMNRSAQSLTDQHQRPFGQDSLAEWSKALAPGASPQGRGFEPHSCHFATESLDLFDMLQLHGPRPRLLAIATFCMHRLSEQVLWRRAPACSGLGRVEAKPLLHRQFGRVV